MCVGGSFSFDLILLGGLLSNSSLAGGTPGTPGAPDIDPDQLRVIKETFSLSKHEDGLIRVAKQLVHYTASFQNWCNNQVLFVRNIIVTQYKINII